MGQRGVPVVWSPDTLRHDPRHEIWVGVTTPGTEVAARVSVILDSLRAAGHHLVETGTDPDALLGAVHDAALLEFLRTAEDRWQAGGYAEDVGQERVVPYLFPTPAMTAGLPARPARAVHAVAGRVAYDTMSLVGPGTWAAARAAAACAAEAAGLVSGGAPLAYALCRPPGHHATPGGYGGSCYVNNAAVAVEALRNGGAPLVGVVDLDAHHGNGTEAIFYERADVLYGSVHVDPGAGWFPHVVGYAEETGCGSGAGATRNVPLSEGAGDAAWLAGVAEIVDWVNRAGCSALVVSLGVDAAADDPESPLMVTTEGYRRAGQLIGATGLPAVVVQEGGYHLPTLGTLVAAYLDGHGSRVRGARSAE
jgi:acetoin utilization deacetylase AcuC-like enzyme